jgi:hypothetical protein
MSPGLETHSQENRLMKDRSTLYLACAALGTLALAAAPAPHAHDNQQSNNQSRRNDLVKIVRQATYKYYQQPVSVAEGDGYQLLFGCVSDDDSGAMGLHYVKLDRYMPKPGVFDAEIKADEPEILLYEPTPWGPRITGADYLVDAATWNQAHPGQTPQLNGQIFHYFGAPNRFGLPPFYTLHVWAWKDSPTGTFVNWHKEVRCDAHNAP